MKIKQYLLSASLCCVASLSIALPQVVDANAPQTTTTISTQKGVLVSQDKSLDMPQRMSNVERSLDNINQMDFPGQISQLEQQIQQLRGSVEVLEHKLKKLKAQQQQKVGELNNAVQVTKTSVQNQQVTALPIEATAAESQPAAINPNLTPTQQAKRTYDAAFSLVRTGSYDDAIGAFSDFLKIYGDDNTYSVNAYYWLGELYAHQEQFEPAKMALSTVVTKYPKSNKVSDAMLKLGIINQKLGDNKQANNWFNKVIKQYPDSSSARMAKGYLKA